MHPLVQRFLAGQLPEPLAQALTGGGLPLPASDQLQALAHAVFGGTPYAERAVATFDALPEPMVEAVLMEAVQPPIPLRLVLDRRKEPRLLELALLHHDLTPEIVEAVVPKLPGASLELVINNQRLWMQRPAILDLAEEHPEAEYAVKRRINEFRFDILKNLPQEVVQERLEILDEVESGRLDAAWASLPLPKEETDEEKAAEMEGRQVLKEVGEDPENFAHKPVKGLDGEDISLTLTQRVMRLKTNQKIMLAIKGGKEERTLLIREANRLIQVNVIRNPRLTEGEVAYIAQMRTVNEEVLRIITLNREWMKKYPIVKNLVFNPRCPLPTSMVQMKRLLEPDMKLLLRDKNVSEVLRREAKRLLELKGSGKG